MRISSFLPPRPAVNVLTGLMLVVALLLLFTTTPAQAQSDPPAVAPDSKKLDIGPDGLLNRAPDVEDDAAKKKAARRALLRRPGQTLPDTAQERDKLLGELYAHLATAESEEAAKRVASSIERVWMHSGSDTVAVLMLRALAASKRDKPDQALKYFGYVVTYAPDYAEGWNQRAYVHFKQNDVTRALGDLRRVLALDPNHFKALEGLAQIMKEMGNKRAALKVFEKLAAVHPFAPGVTKVIDQLKREVGGQEI